MAGSVLLGRVGTDTPAAKVPAYLSPTPSTLTTQLSPWWKVQCFPLLCLADIWESLCRGVPVDPADTAHLLPRPAYPSKCLEPL